MDELFERLSAINMSNNSALLNSILSLQEIIKLNLAKEPVEQVKLYTLKKLLSVTLDQIRQSNEEIFNPIKQALITMLIVSSDKFEFKSKEEIIELLKDI